MKQGLIMYLVGDADVDHNLDLKAAVQDLGFPADQVGLVSATEGFFEVEEAWHYLYTRGCGRIDLMVARAAGSSSLEALKPPVHLCG